MESFDTATICDMFADFFRANYFGGSHDVSMDSINGARISIYQYCGF